MSRCRYGMTAPRECLYICLALLIISSALVIEVQSSAFTRRRNALNKAKVSIEDSTETAGAVPDQIALAATDNQRRKDYGYTNYELNLIRPEQDPRLLTQITTKYSTDIQNTNHETPGSLEDAETAEEYVSKAMQIYGSRLKEPIRIESESESVDLGSLGVVNEHYNDPTKAGPQINAEQNQQYIHQRPSQEETRSQLDSQNPVQLFEQQLRQYKHLQTQQNEKDHSNDPVSSDISLKQPAPVYEKSSQVPTYPIFDDENSYESSPPVDRNYRPKYEYHQNYRSPSKDQSTESEKIRVSASTEIPKAEIMKQIEKSVMKYMKELEAEGKIVTAPKEAKTYYKATPPIEEKRLSSTTSRPRYLTAGITTTYHGAQSTIATSAPHHVSSVPSAGEKSSRYHVPKHQNYKQKLHTENSSPYQTSGISQQREQSDTYGPDVEFVYKIKSRTPLQTATVKTISKPYTLPLKGSTEHFDHSAALKNMEEFDLSHVVTTNEPEERSPSTNKPTKLYFNSEAYQDINSLPYKGDKPRPAEYHRLKESSGVHPEYKGYPGYFAEPLPTDLEKEAQSSADDGYPIINPYKYILKKEPLPNKYEDATPAVNWEKPRPPSKALYTAATAQKAFEYDSYSPKFNNNPEGYGYQHAFKPEREREPLHVIHKHAQRHAPGKRGKRGGAHHSTTNKKVGARNQSKDVETSLALRPPPKV